MAGRSHPRYHTHVQTLYGVINSSHIYCYDGRVALSKAYNYYQLREFSQVVYEVGSDGTRFSGFGGKLHCEQRRGCFLRGILSGRVFTINTRVQRKLLHTWIMSVVVKRNLVQIGRIDGPNPETLNPERRQKATNRWTKSRE